MRWLQTLIRFDWILLLTALTLASVGLVVVYGIGVSRPETSLFLFQKQLVGVALGLAVMLGLAFFDYRQVRSLAIPAYLAGLALLLGVLLFGHTIRGTRGWFVMGGLSFQPVEIAKLALVVFLASYLVRFAHSVLPWQAVANSFLATGAYVILVLLQPDFGSAMVMLAIWIALVSFVGLSWRSLLFLALTATVVAGLSWSLLLKPYQRARFLAFVNPALDERGAGYNVTQAQIAIGSGGLFGKGVGEGSQARLRFLPEAATDFTFAVVGEEMGLTGIAFVLGLFGLLFYRFYRVAAESEDDFASLVILGTGTLFLVHLAVNVGMNLGVMPVTGIPLPFLSAASSFLVAVSVAIGLVESVAVRRRTMG